MAQTAKGFRRRSPSPKHATTVYPPRLVAGVLGGVQTTELNVAIRIAAQVLGQAAKEVSALLTPAEWRLLSGLLEERSIEPEFPRPGPLLAELVEEARARFGVRAQGNEQQGDAPRLVERLAGLSYVQAWAVLIAVAFKRDHPERCEGEAPWWDVAMRWHVLSDE